MIEKVLVTICAENPAFEADMELPAQMDIGELAKKLLEALKMLEPAKFSKVDSLSLECDGKILKAGSTLDAQCIWDGRIITVR